MDNLEDMFKSREQGICPFCKKPTAVGDFRDPLSLKEWQISGICQECQDGFFK